MLKISVLLIFCFIGFLKLILLMLLYYFRKFLSLLFLLPKMYTFELLDFFFFFFSEDEVNHLFWASLAQNASCRPWPLTALFGFLSF